MGCGVSSENRRVLVTGKTALPLFGDYRADPSKRLGSGAFGRVYMGTSTKTNEPCAIKVEHTKSSAGLLHERDVYFDIANAGISPRLLWYGTKEGYTALALSLLGPSVEDLVGLSTLYKEHQQFKFHVFSAPTVLVIAVNVIEGLEKLHKTGWMHRDLKPANLLMPLENRSNRVFLCDFGLSAKLEAKNPADPNNNNKVKRKGITGTPLFASLNNHRGGVIGRGDDLHSLVYIMAFLLNGRLPWSGLSLPKTKLVDEIGRLKTINKPVTLFEGTHKCFTQFCYELDKYTSPWQIPDYAYLRQVLMLGLKDLTGLDNLDSVVCDWNKSDTLKAIRKLQREKSRGIEVPGANASGASGANANATATNPNATTPTTATASPPATPRNDRQPPKKSTSTKSLFESLVQDADIDPHVKPR